MKKFDKLIHLSHKMLDLPDARNKHFTYILKRNKIVSIGYNLSFQTHPLAKRYKYRFSNIHSELAAIKNFPYSPGVLSQYTLVNIRIMADGSIGLSRPCPSCQQLLQDFNIVHIYYSTSKGFKRYG